MQATSRKARSSSDLAGRQLSRPGQASTRTTTQSYPFEVALVEGKDTPAGFLAFTLHAHLPYVVNHGTWPHGMEWLHEAAAETYLPLLRVLGNLERDGVPANFNINLSPFCWSSWPTRLFIAEFPKYLTRKILAAREDEAYFIQSGDAHLTETARFWGRFFSAALDDFNALDGNIVRVSATSTIPA
jgi:1,4-alpha-glucan branching enzyme